MGERLLHSYYIAWDEDEIAEFIQTVVIEGNDFRKLERQRAAQKYLYMPLQGAGTEIKDKIKASLLPAIKPEEGLC
jgi:hypothetical protein